MPKKYQPLGVGMTPSKTELGKFLRACRIKLGLKQVQVAKLSGILQSYYSCFEVGTRRYLNLTQLEGLATALQCDQSELRVLAPPKRQAEPKTELGRFIQERLRALGLTSSEFVRRLDWKSSSPSSFRRRKSIRSCHIQKWAGALECDLSCLERFAFRSKRMKEGGSDLGKRIRSRRIELGLSQQDVAREMGCTRQFMSFIEISDKVTLAENPELIEQLANLLRLNPQELIQLQPMRRLKKAPRDPFTLGGFLTARRLELHLKQWEVDERAGCARGVVGNIERGKHLPSASLLERLLGVLECQIPAELSPAPRKRQARF